MGRNIEQLEEFDSYYRNELNPADKAKFEKKLSEDEELRKNYEEYLIEISSIQYNGRQQIIREFTSSSGSQSNIKMLLRIAAIFIILIVAFVFIYQALKGPDYQEMFISYYEKDQDLTLQKPRGPSENYEYLSKAYAHYQEDQYDAGLIAIAKVESIEENPQGLYIRGLIHMEQSNFEKASPSFQEALKYTSPHEEDIKWYLGLSLLSEEKTDQAIEVFRSIESEKYQQKAEEIINQL